MTFLGRLIQVWVVIILAVVWTLVFFSCNEERQCTVCYTTFAIDWDLRNQIDSLQAIRDNRPPDPVDKTGLDTTMMKGLYCVRGYPVQTEEAIGDSIREQMKSNPIRVYIHTACLDNFQEPQYLRPGE